MNLGLGNLDSLKTHCLQASAQADTSFDDVLAAIGKGVAAAMQGYCNRDFARASGKIDQFSADRSYWIARAYPVEALTSLETQDSYGGAWTAQTLSSVLASSALDRGLIDFGGQLGSSLTRARLTYTGGYFFETLEPDDEGYPTATPAGSTALPDDLRLAWLTQCNAWFIKRDKLNLISAAGQVPEAAGVIAALAARPLEPEVKAMLQSFIRWIA